MTANQRRPGFRLPWAPDTASSGEPHEAASGEQAAERPGTPEVPAQQPPAPAESAPPADSAAPDASADATVASDVGAEASAPDAVESPASVASAPESAAASTGSPESPSGTSADQPDFLRDLVAAMRHVADEARKAGVADIRARADAQVQRIEAETERRRTDLTARAETDVSGVAEWAKTEAERIRAEAEQRVAARRAELDQQLAAEQARGAMEAKALRERVAEYERELGAYHAQLMEIGDPAAFAAAAKRMPAPPRFDGGTVQSASVSATAAETAAPPARLVPTERANGVTPTEPVHPAEEEVLAARLAELDAELPDEGVTAAPQESITTEIVVRGLGSFGAITGFRQALSGADGIEAVALSLGQSGEFIFRATHRASVDLAKVITSLEGEGAKIEARTEGGLLVTLDRAR